MRIYRYRIGDEVLALLKTGPRRGEVVELAGPWWDRWYGVQFRGFDRARTTYYYKRMDLVRLTSS